MSSTPRRVVVRRRAVRTTASHSHGNSGRAGDDSQCRSLALMVSSAVFCLSVAALLFYHSHLCEYLQAHEWKPGQFAPEIPPFECTTSTAGPHTNLTLNASDDLLLHGMGYMPNVLTEDTANDLRAQILEAGPYGASEFLVLSAHHRWSVALHSSTHPSLLPAMQQLTQHSKLQGILENILGPNPAVVEISAIVAEAGAPIQPWHSDSSQAKSYYHYPTVFAEVYSILIPLQDTVPEMGATLVCPGTHRCQSVGSTCLEQGFSGITDFFVDEEADTVIPYWKTGTALIYTSTLQHAGGGHSWPEAPTRVGLIVSVASRPAYASFLTLGPAYCLTWSYWGTTWRDWWDHVGNFSVEQAVGWSFWHSAVMRVMNDEYFFRDVDLEIWLRRSWLWFWLPVLWPVRNTEESNAWIQFGVGTFTLAAVVSGIVHTAYLHQTNHQTPQHGKQVMLYYVLLLVGIAAVWYSLVTVQDWEVSALPDSLQKAQRHPLVSSKSDGAPHFDDIVLPFSNQDSVIPSRILTTSPSRWASHPATYRWKVKCHFFARQWLQYLPQPFLERALIQWLLDDDKLMYQANGRGKFVLVSSNQYELSRREFIQAWSLPDHGPCTRQTSTTVVLCRTLAAHSVWKKLITTADTSNRARGSRQPQFQRKRLPLPNK